MEISARRCAIVRRMEWIKFDKEDRSTWPEVEKDAVILCVQWMGSLFVWGKAYPIDNNGEWFDEKGPDYGLNLKGRVTHWMPLPEPPKTK